MVQVVTALLKQLSFCSFHIHICTYLSFYPVQHAYLSINMLSILFQLLKLLPPSTYTYTYSIIHQHFRFIPFYYLSYYIVYEQLNSVRLVQMVYTHNHTKIGSEGYGTMIDETKYPCMKVTLATSGCRCPWSTPCSTRPSSASSRSLASPVTGRKIDGLRDSQIMKQRNKYFQRIFIERELIENIDRQIEQE